MTLEHTPYKSCIDGEWLPLARQRADSGFSVCGAKRWCRAGPPAFCLWSRQLGRCGQYREELDKLHRQLVEVRLLGPRFDAAVEAEGKVKAPGMARSQRFKDGAELWRTRTDVQ